MISDSVDVFIPLYVRENGIPVVIYGVLQTITTILRMVVIWVMAKPQMKTKKKILLLFFLMNIVNFGLLYGGNEYLYFYIFTMIIITRTVFNTIMNPYLARMLPNEYMGIGFGVRDVFLSLGCAVGLVISGFISGNILAFAMYIIVLLTILLILIFRTNIMETKEIHEEDEEDENNEDLDKWENVPKRLKINFILIIIIGFFISCGLEVHDYSAMIGSDIGVEVQNIYNLYSSSVIITAIFSVLGGIIIDKYDAKIMYLCYIVICFSSCVLLVFQNVYAYAFSLILLGIKGILDNVEQTYFFKIYKEYNLEKLYSANSILEMILSFATPLIFGYLYDISFVLMIMIGIACLFIAMILCLGIVSED